MSGAASLVVLCAAALLAGALSVASPCVLPLVPVYLAAATAGQAQHGRPARRRRAAARFVAGFSAVFVTLGAFAGAAGSVIPAPSQARVAGLVLCAVGLAGLDLLPSLGVVRFLAAGGRSRPSPLLLGAVFALAATPCTTTLLGLGLASAVASATALRGALVLASYGAGLAASLFAVGAAAGHAAGLARRLRRHSSAVSRVAAALTAAAGAMLALGEGWRLDVLAARVLGLL